MATIYPFRAIRANALYASQLVFTTIQAESVAGNPGAPEGLPPLKTLLESGARLRPETPEGQAQAFQDINDTLKTLLEGGQMALDTPGIFIYEVTTATESQTGIWAMTDLQDYTAGRIRTHELTFADSIRRLKSYRENTGLEGSPVLLTYKPDSGINDIMNSIQLSEKPATYGNAHGIHRLWKISDTGLMDTLVSAFTRIGRVYLADGHHRLESAAQLAMEQEHTGKPVYSLISSLYMATDQLRIKAYHRVVVPEKPWGKYELFKALSQHFYIQDAFANRPVLPQEKHLLGLYFEGAWYHMAAKPHTHHGKTPVNQLDASILQNEVFGPLFNITDPKDDPRLKHAGGDKAVEEMEALFEANPYAIAFTVSPLSTEDLVTVSELGEILPPKSTWIDPKVPYGLILYQH